MDASRLLALLQLVEEDAAGAYAPALQELLQLFGQVQANPSQNFYPQIEQVQQRLFSALTTSPVNRLVPTRRAMLVAIGGDELLGARAIQAIRDIIARGAVAGPSAVVSGLTEYSQRLQAFRDNVSKIQSSLSALGVKPDALDPGHFEFGLAVPEAFSKREVLNVTELLKDWNFVL